MKRFPTFLLLPILLTAVSFVPGATSVRAQTTLSLTGGVNLASLATDGDGASAPGFESLTRMSVGLAATIPVTDRFAVQLGGRYVQKGGRADVLGIMATLDDIFGGFDEMPPGARIDADFEMDYVELSVLAGVRFPLSGDRVSGHLLAGPALGLQHSCDGVIHMSGLGEPAGSFSSDCDEGGLDFRKVDLGLAGGAGIDIGLTDSIDVHLGLLYTLGLSNLVDVRDGSVKHRALTIRAGLGIPVG